jgi:hypothetical protein
LTWLTHEHRPQLIKWLRELPKPIGILAADDAVAHDLAASCLDAGIGVPEHVAIVGINNDDLLCESAWPPLSSVEADYSRMGYLAARHLDQLLSGQKLARKDRYVLLPPLGVVQRQSTDVLAVNDPDIAEAIRFIREHACEPCSVPDVLKHVPVGRRWLERQFASTLGPNPARRNHPSKNRRRPPTAAPARNQPRTKSPPAAVSRRIKTSSAPSATSPTSHRRPIAEQRSAGQGRARPIGRESSAQPFSDVQILPTHFRNSPM